MKVRNDDVLLFRTQLSLILLPMIILPLSIIGYFSYNISFHALQARSAANVGQVSSLVNQNLDNTVQQIIQLAKTPLYKQQLQQIITYYSQHPALQAEDADVQDTQYVRDFLGDILIHNDSIASIDIYTMGKAYFSETFHGLEYPTNWRGQSWFREITQTPERTLILPAHSIQFTYDADTVFSIAQAIVNTDTFQTVGAIVINIDTRQAIEQTIAASSKDSDTLFLIYSAKNEKVYATPQSDDPVKNKRAQAALLSLAQQTLRQGKNQFAWENKDYFLSSSTSLLSGLTVAALVPAASLTQDIAAIQQTTLVMICLTLIAVLSSGFFLIDRISKQVTQLRHLMRQVEIGNLDVRFQSQGRGEITSLGKSFNHMVARLKQLIQDNYESQLQRKKAELAALQSQLNPHFLYNTLGTFQMLALMEGQERLATMSYELGQLMRYSLGSSTLVELGEELASVQHFLSLIKERYEERLHFRIEVSEALFKYKIPKFTLQPLVENAIYHGIDPKVEGGTVQVYGCQRGHTLILEILDDGIGMPDEHLQRLQDALRYESNILKRSKHIGMLNVQGQIQSIFGPEYGLSLARDANGGIKVTLCLPLCEQGDAGLEEQL